MIKIYEDEFMFMYLPDEPVAIGHIIVEPKEKAPDIQSLSPQLVSHLFFGASYAATALFELANAQGTNIILEEQTVRINVIARSQDDGLDFLWKPNQANPAELQGIAKSIKDDVDVSVWKKNNPDSSSSSKEKEVIKEITDSGKVNYLLKSLQRRP